MDREQREHSYFRGRGNWILLMTLFSDLIKTISVFSNHNDPIRHTIQPNPLNPLSKFKTDHSLSKKIDF